MPKSTFYNLSAARRARIEAVAIDEFSKNGLKSAVLNNIVAKSGIAKGSFYQYFENIEDLYQHILSLVQKRKTDVASSLQTSKTIMDTFAYLRWLIQLNVVFMLREPKLAKIELLDFVDHPVIKSVDPETGERVSGDGRFHALLTQGVLHDDLATWVDTDMAAYVLNLIANLIAPYLIDRIGDKGISLADGSVNIVYDPMVQALFDNLMDIIEAGIARDPQIRQDFYSK